MKYIPDADRKFIENKYHDTEKPFDPLRRFYYHGTITEYSEGLDDDEMRKNLDEIYEKHCADEAYCSENTNRRECLHCVKAIVFQYLICN